VVGVVAAAFLMAVPRDQGLAAGSSSVSCGERVLRDWSDDGRIEGTFAPHCYREAIAQLPADVRVYSTAQDDITQALGRVAAKSSVRAPRRLSSGRVALAKPPSVAGPGNRSVAPIAASALALTIVTWVVLAARRRSARDESEQ
jgi:hypothetical protein